MFQRVPNLEARSRYKQRLVVGLVLRPMRLFCDHCDKYVPSDMPWRCPHCNEANTKTRLYSFLNKCRTCKRSPFSYVCPHCEKVNLLDVDGAGYSAVALREATVGETHEEQLNRKRVERQIAKEEIESEIEMTALSAKLTRLKASAEFKKARSKQEELEESFSEHDAHVMGAYMLVKEQRRKNEERFKDDAELLEMANMSLEKWLESQM